MKATNLILGIFLALLLIGCNESSPTGANEVGSSGDLYNSSSSNEEITELVITDSLLSAVFGWDGSLGYLGLDDDFLKVSLAIMDSLGIGYELEEMVYPKDSLLLAIDTSFGQFIPTRRPPTVTKVTISKYYSEVLFNLNDYPGVTEVEGYFIQDSPGIWETDEDVADQAMLVFFPDSLPEYSTVSDGNPFIENIVLSYEHNEGINPITAVGGFIQATYNQDSVGLQAIIENNSTICGFPAMDSDLDGITCTTDPTSRLPLSRDIIEFPEVAGYRVADFKMDLGLNNDTALDALPYLFKYFGLDASSPIPTHFTQNPFIYANVYFIAEFEYIN